MTHPDPLPSHVDLPQPPKARHYVPTLDGWRAVAILIVLISHAADSIARFLRGAGWNSQVNMKFGFFGVGIFFALSGFLITTQMVFNEREQGAFNVRQFYWRRCFRILPAAYFYLIVVALLSFSGVLGVSLERWISSLLFFNNYSTAADSWYVDHFWSLAVEEHYYLLWPIVFVVSRNNKTRLIAAVALAIFIAIWRMINFKYLGGFTSHHIWSRTDICADSILWGAIFALIRAQPGLKRRLDRLYATPWVLRALIVMIVLLGCKFLAFPGWWLGDLLAHTFLVFFIPMAIFGGITRSTGRFASYMESAPLRWIGRISFSLYLYQQLFMVLDEGESIAAPWNVLQSFPLNFLMTFCVAIVSYHFIEQPFIKLGRKIERRRARAAAS